MKNIIIVSMCTRVLRKEFEFHFKGALFGESIERVILRSEQPIARGEEYLLYVAIDSVREGVLRGRILTLRLLSDCWDRS